MKLHTHRTAEAGNVLFYILIAVTLIAALSYAVANSGRGNVQQLSDERARLFATEILEYANILANAVAQTRLRGFNDTQISFENNEITGYANANCSSDVCKIFHPNGAGVTFSRPADEWLDTNFSAFLSYNDITFYSRACVESLTCDSDGIDNEDLIFFIPYVRREICLAINDLSGVDNPAGEPPLEVGCSGSGGTPFSGAYLEVTALKDAGNALNKNVGCFRHDAGCPVHPNSYHFYKVLISR